MTILKIENLTPEGLGRYRNHHRLRVFAYKGVRCIHCGIEGNKLVKHRQSNGYIHIDIFYWGKNRQMLITRDHLFPKSKGGSDSLDNLYPMCERCNHKKGDRLPFERSRVIPPTL